MPAGWVAAAGAVAGAYISSEGAKDAADTAAGGQRAASAESRRQFNIGQENQQPWLQAGQQGLEGYQGMLGQQGAYEGKIRSNIQQPFQSGSQIPGAYQSQTNVPGAYQGQSGDYFGNIQSNVQPGFKFGAEEFNQYKDPGYDFRMEQGMKGLERANAKSGNRGSGYSQRSMMELGQNLGSQEFGAARGRAMADYQSGVSREAQRYGRSNEDFNRRTGREAELYGRGRQQVQDVTQREQAMYGRGRQYAQDLAGREQAGYTRQVSEYGMGRQSEMDQYNRDIAQYGRTYLDPMARQQGLAQMGQNTATGMASQGAMQGQEQGGYAQNAANAQYAGQLGSTGAYAGALGSLGSIYQNYNQPSGGGYNYNTDYQNPMQQTPQYTGNR